MKLGEDFYVRDTRFVLVHVEDENRFTVRNDETGEQITITDQEAVEIAPGTTASSGGYFMQGQIRIALDAPRSVLILRGDRYRGQASAEMGEVEHGPQ
jgi:hypothetical protein